MGGSTPRIGVLIDYSKLGTRTAGSGWALGYFFFWSELSVPFHAPKSHITLRPKKKKSHITQRGYAVIYFKSKGRERPNSATWNPDPASSPPSSRVVGGSCISVPFASEAAPLATVSRPPSGVSGFRLVRRPPLSSSSPQEQNQEEDGGDHERAHSDRGGGAGLDRHRDRLQALPRAGPRSHRPIPRPRLRPGRRPPRQCPRPSDRPRPEPRPRGFRSEAHRRRRRRRRSRRPFQDRVIRCGPCSSGWFEQLVRSAIVFSAPAVILSFGFCNLSASWKEGRGWWEVVRLLFCFRVLALLVYLFICLIIMMVKCQMEKKKMKEASYLWDFLYIIVWYDDVINVGVRPNRGAKKIRKLKFEKKLQKKKSCWDFHFKLRVWSLCFHLRTDKYEYQTRFQMKLENSGKRKYIWQKE